MPQTHQMAEFMCNDLGGQLDEVGTGRRWISNSPQKRIHIDRCGQPEIQIPEIDLVGESAWRWLIEKDRREQSEHGPRLSELDGELAVDFFEPCLNRVPLRLRVEVIEDEVGCRIKVQKNHLLNAVTVVVDDRGSHRIGRDGVRDIRQQNEEGFVRFRQDVSNDWNTDRLRENSRRETDCGIQDLIVQPPGRRSVDRRHVSRHRQRTRSRQGHCESGRAADSSVAFDTDRRI